MNATITAAPQAAITPAYYYVISDAAPFDNARFWELWLKWIQDRAASTQEGYSVTVAAFLNWLTIDGEKQPNRDTIIRYRKYLTEPHTDRRSGSVRTYSADTAARYFRGVKMFFSFLEANGLYRDITKNIRTPKGSTAEFNRDALERQDILNISNSFDKSTETGKRDYAIFLAIVSCAFRISEIQRANIEDLETHGNEHRLYIQGKGHTAKDAYKKVEPELYSAIHEYLHARGKADAKAPLFASCKSNARPGGTRLTVSAISRIIKLDLKAAGYNSKRITAHSLRHTSITLDRKAGATLEEAKKHARHSNITITQRYDHILEHADAKDERRILDYIFNGETAKTDAERAATLFARIPEGKRKAALEMLEAMAK